MEAITENPFRQLAIARNWRVEDLAQALGLPIYKVRALYNGRVACLPEDWRERVAGLDLDFDAIRISYARWRDTLFGAPVPVGLDPSTLSDPERRIVDAIGRGIRGVNSIAQTAGVPRAQVDGFLKSNRFQVS